MSSGSRKKVVILGGGVAGMSAAHELVERGFEVEVFERKALAGGKARSIAADMPTPGPSRTGPMRVKSAAAAKMRPPLPGEHGFRFFPGFYRHVIDTMGRIPYESGSVADNLVDTTELEIASFGRPAFSLPAKFPSTLEEVRLDLFAVVATLAGQVGVALDEAAFFATKMWQFLTSCEERRLVDYERVNWWDFIEAAGRSPSYQKYFGSGITRSLVAAKARRASTKTIGDIFMQIVFGIVFPGVAADRVLNGPTSDVWINPWLKHLRARGVTYHMNTDVRAIRCERGVVRSVTVAAGKSVREVTGDYFVGALPVERMTELMTPDVVKWDPSLVNLGALTEYVEWMNGIQYFLTEDVPLSKGHTIYIDSPWALTSISQAQFWKHFDLSKYGDGTVKGVLSVDISDWDVEGLNGKEARMCSREEVALQAWEQIKKSVNVGRDVLTDRHLHSWFLDPDIEDPDLPEDQGGRRATNSEPLLVNYVDTWRLRPEAVTRIPNFFLASDYVRTHTDLATMEAANEAARRAVNGILRASGVDAAPCAIWNLHEPEAFVPFRAYDRLRYRKGLTWDASAMDVATQVLSVAAPAAALFPMATRPSAVPPAVDGRGIAYDAPDGNGGPAETAVSEESDAATTAAEARQSSDEGLRRWRIVRTKP